METQQAQSEIAIIKKIMEDSRKINIDNGIHYIFWGVLVTVCLLINYVMLLTKTAGQFIGLMWFIAMIAGGIIDGWIGKRQENKSPAITFTGKLLGSLWLASGVAMFIYGFIGMVSKAYNPVFICPIIATSLGISYFTSGAIQQIKWLQYLSLGWWGGAIVLFIFPSIHSLLIFAVMLILFQIVPGIILRKKSNLETEYKLVSENN